MFGDFDFDDIKRLIKANESAILKRTNSGLHENQKFKRFHTVLYSYKSYYPLNGLVAVLIRPEEIENLVDDFTQVIFDVINACIEKSNNHVIIDRKCEIVSSDKQHYKTSQEARQVYLNISKDFCVFIIKPEGIHYFLNGDDVGEIIFFSRDDEARFNERKDVSQINDVFDDYRIKLTIQDTYRKFFVSKSGKSALYHILLSNGALPQTKNSLEAIKQEKKFFTQYQNLLENKPENSFREDLRKYLDDELKGNVIITKEHLLESFKRLDILITDEYGDLFLIEVKWVGTSIHASGRAKGTTYDQDDINPDAIVQTVNYLMELDKHKKPIKMGYLVVFDARNGDQPDTVATFDTSKLKTESARFYSRFRKIADLKVKNAHPS
ncbi:hypothetical protein [Mucilaginibacter sp. PAMB04168]|uniref:hypothetical protein n=1 Tax=Mucilaginibacter sp. PAMB04168 TaxID=3138567 RepID=UPI0031F67F21